MTVRKSLVILSRGLISLLAVRKLCLLSKINTKTSLVTNSIVAKAIALYHALTAVVQKMMIGIRTRTDIIALRAFNLYQIVH